MTLEKNTDKKQMDTQVSPALGSAGMPSSNSHLAYLPNEHTSYAIGNHSAHARGPKLAAERIFDAAVYGAWNYGLQAGTSVAASLWFQKGGGKPYFDQLSESLGKHVFEKITSKTGAAAAAEARTPLLFTSLILVGNLFVPPMQYAEAHKAEYVSKINDWLNTRRTAKGDAPDAEERAEQQAEIQAIAHAPRQSSKELWTGRVLGLLANYGATVIVGDKNNKAVENVVADTVSKSFNGVGLKSLANSETVKDISRLAFLDYGYSIISSNVMYVYGHYINPPEHEKDEQQPDAQVALNDDKPITHNQVTHTKKASHHDDKMHNTKIHSALASTHSNHIDRIAHSKSDLGHIGGAI